MRGTTALIDAFPLHAKRVSFVRMAGRMWLMVELLDGRAAGLPLAAFPTLQRARPAARERWRLIGRGSGIHWPSLDLDLSVHGILERRGEGARRTKKKIA